MKENSAVKQAKEIEEYLDRIGKRIVEMESLSKELVTIEDRRKTQLKRIVARFKVEIKNLHDRLAKEKRKLINDQREIKVLITEFKDVVKKEGLDKLNDRIEEWGPDKFVNRNEVLKRIRP